MSHTNYPKMDIKSNKFGHDRTEKHEPSRYS